MCQQITKRTQFGRSTLADFRGIAGTRQGTGSRERKSLG